MRNGGYKYYDDSREWPAFFGGVLLGGAVAFLVAPRTGSQLRGLLYKYASRWKGEVLEQGRATWDAAVERDRSKVQGAVQKMELSTQGIEEGGKEALKKAS